MTKPERPVVVVGAGPTGVTAAILLALHDVPTVVLDLWAEVYPQPRAVHLDDEVHRILGRLGVAEEFAAVSRPALGLRMLNRDLTVLGEFRRSGDTGAHGYPQANMFDQPELEQVLRTRMHGLDLVDFRGAAQVTGLTPWGSWDGPITVAYDDAGTGEQHTVEAAAVLGCDGSGSTVRSAIGATMTDLGFEQHWLVVDVDTAADLGQWDGVHQVCDRHRAATFMRVGQHRYRWEFQLLEGEDPVGYRTLADVLPLIAPWTGDTPPADMRVLRVADYVFRAQLADRWRRGTVFLLGDAAHLTPPFIGQGIGAGLRDAHNLVWKLAAVRAGLLPDAVLDSYEAERRPHARTMILTAKAVGVAMTGGGLMGELLRSLVLPRSRLVPGLRGRVLDSETPRLHRSSLLPRRRWAVGPAALGGRLAPNRALPAGGRLDEAGRGQLLVTRAAVTPTQRAQVTAAGGTVVDAPDGSALAAWLQAARATAVLVRPDLTIMAAGRDIAELVSRLLPLATGVTAAVLRGGSDGRIVSMTRPAPHSTGTGAP